MELLVLWPMASKFSRAYADTALGCTSSRVDVCVLGHQVVLTLWVYWVRSWVQGCAGTHIRVVYGTNRSVLVQWLWKFDRDRRMFQSVYCKVLFYLYCYRWAMAGLGLETSPAYKCRRCCIRLLTRSRVHLVQYFVNIDKHNCLKLPVAAQGPCLQWTASRIDRKIC